MNDPRQHCCDLRRLRVLAASGSANAIAFLEVRDRVEPLLALRQRTLFVTLLRRDASVVDGGGLLTLGAANVAITGGVRIPNVAVEWVALADALPAGEPPSLVADVEDPGLTLVVRTASTGDFSRYTLALVSAPDATTPPPGFDPRLASIEFSFKVECPTPFDCATVPVCPPSADAAPELDYLARDYEGLRRLMLDRLALTVPGWTERSAADVGVMLVELLAYAADNLAYRQDAIATEAYLGTARRRVSVRRHARLVDYHLHEGCNARAWVQLQVQGAGVPLPRRSQLLARTPGLPTLVAPGSQALRDALAAGALVFETARDEVLDEDLNALDFHTWGDEACCLPAGTVRATLRGHHPALQAGAFVAFVEQRSPTTGTAADADRTHRHVVRLVQATPTVDPSGRLFDDPPVDAPLDVTEIEWDAQDALPFALCLSASAFPGLAVARALGNIVLVDQGMTVGGESLGSVPAPSVFRVPTAAATGCTPPAPLPVPARYMPALAQSPLTQSFGLAARLALPLDEDRASWHSASRFAGLAAADAQPDIALSSALGSDLRGWTAQRDLLASGPESTDFVVEIDDQRRTALRFGDDTNGLRPDEGTAFTASYRVGNGSAGNVGAESIAHLVTGVVGSFVSISNPVPAFGGSEAEDIEAARRDAPQAFRTQLRAVTAADYAGFAEQQRDVQRAAARFRWTGSWHTVFVTADRVGAAAVDAPFKARLRRQLERFRMAGYDLEIDAPQFVALDIELHVCVAAGYFRAQVLQAVSERLSAGVRANGQPGFFHPDRFTFGQPVWLSPLVAAVQAVDGVDAVTATRFQRLLLPGATSLADGVIPIGRFEVAELANDPNFRERGRLVIDIGGGS